MIPAIDESKPIQHPVTQSQRSFLAKEPNYAIAPRHQPYLEYITVIESACQKLNKKDAEELREDINRVLRGSHSPSLNLQGRTTSHKGAKKGQM